MVFTRSCHIMFVMSTALLYPTPGWAWGGEGHRIIALVAERILEAQYPSAQKRVKEILATDKSNPWTKTDFASEATWADALRENSPEGRAATSKWHYVKLDADKPDLKKACFGRAGLPAMTPASHATPDNCAIDKISQFARELRDPETYDSERLMALQFLLNLVGDIHDPLYTIEHKDQGGQCTAVLPPGAKSPVRLSVYWDDTLVAEAEGKDPVKAAGQIAAQLSTGEIEKWSGSTPEQWAQESYSLAKTIVYNLPPASGKFRFPEQKGERNSCDLVGVHKVDANYQNRAVATIKEQLAKAGVRLAFLLRENLK
jgi:hypothetical protein